MKKALIIAALLSPSIAMAQVPDIDTLQRAVNVARDQRIRADDRALDAETTVSKLRAELERANARIKELEDAAKAPPGK